MPKFDTGMDKILELSEKVRSVMVAYGFVCVALKDKDIFKISDTEFQNCRMQAKMLKELSDLHNELSDLFAYQHAELTTILNLVEELRNSSDL